MALPDDKVLIKKLLEKDEKTFCLLFNSYYGIMYSVAKAIVGESIADEVVQEAWVSVMRGLPGFEGRSSLKSWIVRIVANEAKTRRRKEVRSQSLDAMQDDWATDPRFVDDHWQNPSSQWHGDTPEELLTAEELRRCLEHNMNNLSEQQLAVLTMKDSGAFSLDEICNIIDVSSSNVRVLLHRARDKMLQVIDHFERTGEC